MEKIKIFNDGSQPKLQTRILIIQIVSITQYVILPFSELSLIFMLVGTIFTPLIAFIFLKD